ncbi:MAG TPA: DUF1800 domain-containing protein [Bacteroidia bacterium]|nr:DUF1800 domain-containing protein [Bacteroidia bacterium]
MSSQKLFHHLCWRSGFGPDPGADYQDYEVEVVRLFADNAPGDLTVPGWTPTSVIDIRAMSLEKRKEYQRTERQARLKLGYLWFTKMAAAPNPFPEKMAFFWSGHFACRVNSAQFGLRYVNALRKNALGNFGDLLRAMIRDAALLQFLNNNQNVKGNPNENFAREFFELFTLGRGNYTEQDVKEAARALTGWGFDREGLFTFRTQLHDSGTKTIFGNSGNYDGDDLVDLVLKRRECAMFISYKICRQFQSDSPDIGLIKNIADALYSSNYNIRTAMETLFRSPQFRSEDCVGSKIKSPVELLAGLFRMFDIKPEKETSLLQLQRALGQVPLNPPNVGGWTSGKGWIDSSTLFFRMRLSQLLLAQGDVILDPKAEFDAQQQTIVNNRKIKTTFDTVKLNQIPVSKDENQLQVLSDFLLQIAPSKSVAALIKSQVTANGGSALLKSAIMLMSLPEYQIC